MNAEVEIHVAQRPGAIAIPNAALRTQRDVGSAAQVLGLDAQAVMAVLAAADSQRGTRNFGGETPSRRAPDDPPARPAGQLARRSQTGFGPGGQRVAFGASGPARPRFGASNSFQFGGSYIVFALRGGKPAPVRIRTGVTDMDYSEVVSGLTENDTVLMLPSASLINSQAQMRARFERMSGNALPGMRQQPSPQGGQQGQPGQGGGRAPAPRGGA